jgi:fumarate reductase flavoprotein subunit
MSSKEKEKQNLSRREFLKGSLVGAGGIAGASLLAVCNDNEKACSTSDASQRTTSPSPEAGQCPTSPASDASTQQTATQYSFEPPPASIPEANIKETVTTDVVIIGAGDSGLAATLAVVEAGSRAILLEKSSSFNSRGFGNGAINTKYHQSQGIAMDKQRIVNDLMQWSGNKADQKRIELWANHSAEVYDHLIDLATNAGLTITMFPAANDPASRYPEYPTCLIFGSKMSQADLLSVIEKETVSKGADIRYEMTAEQLERDTAGRVSSVVVRNKEGSYIRVTGTKGVILATGDYGNNPEMMDKWCAWAKNADQNVYVPAVNTGDGHKMGLWIGGAMQDGPHAPMVHANGGGPFSSNPLLRVNGLGERYENEDVPNTYICNSRMRQPGNAAWAIFDSQYAQYVPKTTPGFARAVEVSDATGAAIEAAIANGTVLKADTLEGLAAAMSVPVDTFVATVARYTELAKAGNDEDFSKPANMLAPIETAPFYASKVPVQLLVTLGGFKTNGNLQVLDKDSKVISGLYAVGNVSGGFFANDYPVLASGISHGRCITEGYLAGRHAATSGA